MMFDRRDNGCQPADVPAWLTNPTLGVSPVPSATPDMLLGALNDIRALLVQMIALTMRQRGHRLVSGTVSLAQSTLTQLVPSALACAGVWVAAPTSNAQPLKVGGAGTSTSQYMTISPGDARHFLLDDASQVYVLSDGPSDTALWTAEVVDVNHG